MPEKLKALPGTDEEVTSSNWREIKPGDHVWYVPDDAKTVEDVKLCVVASWSEYGRPHDNVSLYVIEGCPTILTRVGRLSLAEPRPQALVSEQSEGETTHGA